MKRQFPGLHSELARAEDALEGVFLVPWVTILQSGPLACEGA